MVLLTEAKKRRLSRQRSRLVNNLYGWMVREANIAKGAMSAENRNASGQCPLCGLMATPAHYMFPLGSSKSPIYSQVKH